MRALPIRKAVPLRVRLSLNWPVMKVLGLLAWPHRYLDGHRMRWTFSEGEYDTAAAEKSACGAHPGIPTVSVDSDCRVNGLMYLPLPLSTSATPASRCVTVPPVSPPAKGSGALLPRLLRWLRRGVQ